MNLNKQASVEGTALHVHTPLEESYPMSKLSNYNVLLKLDNVQPTGSFKIRGLGHQVKKCKQAGFKRLVVASGGNAGLAATYAAKKVGLPISVILPSTSAQGVKDRIKHEGGDVIIHGSVWDVSNARALEMAKEPEVAYISAFNHPDVWTGHSTVIHEAAGDIKGLVPDLVIVSVGGGGLLCGVAQGMSDVGWSHVPILAMETIGADCFNQAVKAGKIVTLPAITSIAKCLGALTVAERAFQYYKERKIISEVVTDKQCVEAVSQFLDDHRCLVEPACGAAIAAIYAGVVERLEKEGTLTNLRNILVIVCGGSGVTQVQLAKWKNEFSCQ